MPSDSVSVFGIVVPLKELGIAKTKPKKYSVTKASTVKTLHKMIDVKDLSREKPTRGKKRHHAKR